MLAWSEAKRPQVQAMPHIRVPRVEPHMPEPATAVGPPTGGCEVSQEELGPTVASTLPDTGRYRQPLLQIQLAMAGEGALWDPLSPHASFALLARSALRLEPGTIASYLLAWQTWSTWWWSQERNPADLRPHQAHKPGYASAGFQVSPADATQPQWQGFAGHLLIQSAACHWNIGPCRGCKAALCFHASHRVDLHPHIAHHRDQDVEARGGEASMS